MRGFHCTTPKKLAMYEATGAILPPVRFWTNEDSARQWMRRTGRTVLLEIEVSESYPLPDHKPLYHAHWSPNVVRQYSEVTV